MITTGPSFSELPSGATIGTSSERRRYQLLDLRPDLKIIDIRGNVPTRLSQVAESSSYDGIILAEAGLLRLGYPVGGTLPHESHSLHSELFPAQNFLPAAGQGAVALEIRKDNSKARELLSQISHSPTFNAITAERHFLALLQAGCDTPVGVLSSYQETTLHLNARVYEQDGQVLEASSSHSDPLIAAQQLFDNLSTRSHA